MRVQHNLNIVTVVLSLVTGFLLYIKIVDYYQLSNLWVDHPDARLKNYILLLWILVAVLILSVVMWFYFREKDLSFKTWIGFGILLAALGGSIFQFTHSPNYTSYYVTPFPIGAKVVEKAVNSKAYNPSKDAPIYFYRKSDNSYPKVRKLIRQYSLTEKNDFPCIDLATLKSKLGKKRYDTVIKNAKVNSNNAIFLKYYNSNDDVRRITFNNLQKSNNLNKALNFIDNN